MFGITLIVDRKVGDLWLLHDGLAFETIWDVTGVKRGVECFRTVYVLRKGKTIGIVWNVEKIRERWG